MEDPFIAREKRVMARWVRRYHLPAVEFVRRHGAAYRARHDAAGHRVSRRPQRVAA